MRGRELYGKYHRLIDEFSRKSYISGWQQELWDLLDRFESEMRTLAPASGRLLCEELCTQLDGEALRATNEHRRDVLVGAAKCLELMSF